MDTSAWSTPFGRVLAICCGTAAILGFIVSAGVQDAGHDSRLGADAQENYEAAAANLEAMADHSSRALSETDRLGAAAEQALVAAGEALEAAPMEETVPEPIEVQTDRTAAEPVAGEAMNSM